MTKQRVQQLDLLKSMAIFMVVFQHISTYNINFMHAEGLLPLIRYLLVPILSTCVPIFYVINGYLLFQRKLDVKTHLLKTLRLFCLTLLWIVILSTSTMLIRGEWLGLFQWLKLIFHWREDLNNNILWYMAVLVSIYLLFPILKVVYDRHFKLFVYFTLLLAILTIGNTTLLSLINVIKFQLTDSHSLSNYKLASLFSPFHGPRDFALVYFCLGGIFYRYESKIKAWITLPKQIAALFILLLSSVSFGFLGILFSKNLGFIWNVVWFNMDSLNNLISVVCLFVLTMTYQKNIAIVTHTGQNTLGIYLLHMIFIELSRPKLENIAFFQTYFGNAIYTIAIIGLCLVAISILKKIPYLRRILAFS